MQRLGGLVAIAIVSVAPLAHAEDVKEPSDAELLAPTPAVPPAPAAPPEREWYGWQTLLVDGVAYGTAIGVLAIASSSGRGKELVAGGGSIGPLLPIAPAMFVIGAPIVHAAHGYGKRALLDGFFRLAAPTLLMGLGAGVSSDGIQTPTPWIGLGLGLIGMTVVDAAVIAYEPADRTSVRVWPGGFAFMSAF